MTRTLKIEHRICRANLGESDDAYATQYVAALTAALESEYPGAEIDVNLDSDFANACQTLVSGERVDEQRIRENVGEIANRVWDRM